MDDVDLDSITKLSDLSKVYLFYMV